MRRVKEGTSAVLLQSGLDKEWWADSIECYCYLQNIWDLLSDEKTPYERRLGQSKEIRFWEHPPQSGKTQTQEKNKIFFEDNQKGPLQLHDKTHHGMMVNPKVIFGLSQEISLTVIMWNPRVKLFAPTEESFPVPVKYKDVTRTTDTTKDVMSEKHIEDYWNVHGERDLSDAWTGFTRFLLLNEKPPDRYTWSGRRLTRKQTTSRPDNVCPDMWKQRSDAPKRKEKQKVGLSRNQNSIMPEDCVVFTSLNLMMRNSRISWTMLVESWKFRCQQEFLVKLCCAAIAGKPGAPLEDTRQKYACIVEADESMRIRKRLRLRMPQPMSLQTRCSVWEVSMTNQSNPGRTKSNGIGKFAISKIWIELMESDWNSRGKYSQDSLHWASSKRFKKYDWITVWTWAWKHTKCETNSVTVRIVLADSRSHVGHFWDLDQKRIGMELVLVNQMENETRLLN